MGPTTVQIRCPACGAELRVVLAAGPATQWFPCPQCGQPVPVVVPRDPPPLYTWEVTPGLYPPLPAPKAPRWRIGPVTAIALCAVTVLSAVLGGLLAVDGWQAAAPARYSVDGVVVDSAGVPIAGVAVVLIEEGNRTQSGTTGGTGRFAFSGVPSGGVEINLSRLGYAPLAVYTFASPGYDAGTTGLVLVMSPGGSANASSVVLSPFPDLESFLASIGGGAVLLGIAAAVSGAAAAVTFRRSRGTFVVIGGGAGVGAPAAVYLLSIEAAFPLLAIGTAVVGAFGAFVVSLAAVDLARRGEPVGAG